MTLTFADFYQIRNIVIPSQTNKSYLKQSYQSKNVFLSMPGDLRNHEESPKVFTLHLFHDLFVPENASITFALDKTNVVLLRVEDFAKLRYLDLKYNSLVFPFVMNKKQILIYEAYKTHKKSKDVEVAFYGQWTEENGLSVNTENIWDRRVNLKHAILRFIISICQLK